MTEHPKAPLPNAEFSHNLTKIAEQSQLVLQEFMRKQALDQDKNPAVNNALNIAQAFGDLFTHILADPTRFWQAQLELVNAYTQLFINIGERLSGKNEPPLYNPPSKDRRFQDAAWQENIVFDYLKQSYLLTSNWMQRTVHNVEGVDPHTKHKVEFYTRQYLDAVSPTNFLMSNPEVLRKTAETNGENLVKGLQNLLHDLEQSKEGMLKISTTDESVFELGKNIATTPGSVVFQNDLLQLIQYAPSTKTVFKTPLLIISPWINKYYVLDLKQENSYVAWLTSQGYTVFITSWVNPDKSLSHKTFEDYMKEGALASLDAIEGITGEKKINVIGYCLGGTLLAATLAYLKVKKQDRVKAATFFTTLVDFKDAGDICVFIDEEQLEALETRLHEEGVYNGTEMGAIFSMLRANDMIWSFVVNNYLLGKDPFPFDLLFWNADSTRMPAAMHSFYLRNMYQKNLLVKPGGLKLGGVPIDLGVIDTPTYILSTREDHIAPWKATYEATNIYKGPVEFVLSGSGHIAGVINPPTKEKYGYWTYDANKKPAKTKAAPTLTKTGDLFSTLPANPVAGGKRQNQLPDADTWLEHAVQHDGSWWPHWHAWAAKHSGEKVPARAPGGNGYKVIEPAPGSYVKVRCE